MTAQLSEQKLTGDELLPSVTPSEVPSRVQRLRFCCPWTVRYVDAFRNAAGTVKALSQPLLRKITSGGPQPSSVPHLLIMTRMEMAGAALSD